MESNFHIRLFSEKMEYYEIHIFRPYFTKSWIHQIAHIKYWIIYDLTNDASVMDWYTLELEITAAYLRRWPSTFWKKIKKKVVGFHTEKSDNYRNKYPG